MKRIAAFSLVELSIVLVILGLLVGGVLTGQSLIHAAELRAVPAELNRYVAATHSFRDKYFTLPGDMPNATAFWGVAAGSGNDGPCAMFASNDTKTCNGNGDGKVAGTPSGTPIYEDLRFWQHLVNAGLIEGHFTGGWVGSGPYYIFGTNTPYSKISNATWYSWYFGTMTASTTEFAGNYGNALQFGSTNPTGAILNPTDTWNIDTKMDDGLPGTGKVISSKGTASEICTSVANSTTDAGAVYALSTTAISCSPYFLNAF